MKFGHAILPQFDFGCRAGRPNVRVSPDMFFQPYFAVISQFFGIVMSSCLNGEVPGHTGLEILEGVAPPFVPPVVIVGSIEPKTGGLNVWGMSLWSEASKEELLSGRG